MKGDFPTYFLPEEMAGFASRKMPKLKVLEKADIDVVVGQFAAAAGRAKRAGFDAIEIHSGHGYRLSSFMSPKTNTRDQPRRLHCGGQTGRSGGRAGDYRHGLS